MWMLDKSIYLWAYRLSVTIFKPGDQLVWGRVYRTPPERHLCGGWYGTKRFSRPIFQNVNNPASCQNVVGDKRLSKCVQKNINFCSFYSSWSFCVWESFWPGSWLYIWSQKSRGGYRRNNVLSLLNMDKLTLSFFLFAIFLRWTVTSKFKLSSKSKIFYYLTLRTVLSDKKCYLFAEHVNLTTTLMWNTTI